MAPAKPDFASQLGERIRARRKAAKLGQTDLAEAIGVAVSTLSRYESGDLSCDAETLARIAAALKCKPSVLVDGIKPGD